MYVTDICLFSAFDTNCFFQLGLNYGVNNNQGACKTEQEIVSDLAILSKDVKTLKTYALANCDTLKNVGQAVAEINANTDQKMKVIFGVQPGDDTAYAAELAAMDQYLPKMSVDTVTAFTVGSESLYRKDYTAQQLADKIAAVKTHLLTLKDKNGNSWSAVPVGTVDSWNVLVDGANTAAIKACDVVFANAFSYWQGQTMANASYSFFDDIMQALQVIQTAKGSTDIDFWVGETGWPTEGGSFGDSVPSVDNAKTFWQQGICGIRAWGINVAVFEAFDEPWKPQTSDIEGVENSWGVYDQNQKLKYDLTCNL